MNTVVYQWLREDGSPYYVGIGNPKRPYTGKRCCGGPPSRDRIVILHEGLEWEKACEIEKELIAFYGRKDLGTGVLRNLTNGGDGAKNPSKETRAKISRAGRGRKLSSEHKQKILKANKGRECPKEVREKISKSHLGMKLSEEVRKKISKANKGKKRSKEIRARMSGKGGSRYTPRGWYHPVHGEILQKSSSDLVEMFPEQKLHSGCLSQVANGKLFQHKEWRSLKNKDVSPVNKLNKLRDWYHPIHGKILQKSCKELVEMFPEQKLNHSCLSRVALGYQSHHKGWTKFENPMGVE
jgi:hypothetical protein